jgi:hypothetical protein
LPQETPDEGLDGVGLEAILVRYVAADGTDSGDCSTPLSACSTLGYAVSLSTEGTTIYITGGSFTVSFLKITQNNLQILGGWNSAFDVQNSQTTIQGSTGITVKALNVTFSKLTIKNISNAVSVDSSRSLLIEDSLLTDNGYAIEGGGTITIKNSALTNNTGAAVKTSGAVTIINSTISGNYFGVLNSGSVSLINVTLANNKYGIQQSSSLPVTTLKNSLVVENLNTCLYNGQFQSEGHNLFDQPCNTLTMQSTDRLFTGAVISPLLNQTHHALLPGSPAINALDSSISGVYCPETDQRGVERGSRCDTGAYEYTAPAAPAKLFIYRGTNQGVGPMQMPHVPLEVYVLDNTGSPVPGVTVQFTAPSEGASGAMGAEASATFKTGKNGIASASTFRANTIPGSYAVTASVNGIVESVSFQLTNGTVLYAVGDEGSTTSDCRSVSTACRFRTAIEKAASGDVILVKSGDTYSNELSISKNLYLSGAGTAALPFKIAIADSWKERSGLKIHINWRLNEPV